MKKGICHICGKNTELTFEHLPPNKAYNDHKVKVINGVDYIGRNQLPWDYSGVKYEYSQKGSGLLSICEKCNNCTGKWYGNEYIKFSNSVLKFLLDNEKDIDKANAYEFKFKDFYPLRFLKQVVSMFASIFYEETVPNDKELQRFILDRDYNVLNPLKYRITMYVLKTPKNAWFGNTAMINIYTKSIKEISVLDLFPLGFEFEFNPIGEPNNLDITQFANNYGYYDKCDITMVVYARERNGIFPGDYRTKEEIEKTAKENKAKI